jgi:hypothetical protein
LSPLPWGPPFRMAKRGHFYIAQRGHYYFGLTGALAGLVTPLPAMLR